MNYRLADVQHRPGQPAAGGHRLAGGWREVGRLRRRRVGPHLYRPVGGRANPEGDRGHAGAAPGGHGLHPFHSSAVSYRDKNILFLGGESNHGKSMGQLEANRRGGLLVSTETTVIDDDGVVRHGLQDVYLKKRAKGTERADKAGAERGRAEVLRRDADVGDRTGPAPSTSSSCPPSTATTTPSTSEMIPFERQFQTLHSLQNYFLLNELLAPGWPMPIVDTEALRRRRARVRRALH